MVPVAGTAPLLEKESTGFGFSFLLNYISFNKNYRKRGFRIIIIYIILLNYIIILNPAFYSFCSKSGQKMYVFILLVVVK